MAIHMILNLKLEYWSASLKIEIHPEDFNVDEMHV